MTSKPEIKAVVFDAYGTLFDVHSVVSLCNEIFPDKGEAISNAWRSRQLQYTWLRALMGKYENFWQVTESALIYACNSLDLACKPEDIRQLLEAYERLDIYSEVQQALAALSDYPLAILSNGSPRMLEKVVENAGLKSNLSHIFSVDEIQTFKPRPEVYKLAEDKLGIDKSSIAFVSSNSWDIVGGTAYGLWTCWVNRARAVPEELGFIPNLEVHNLTEFVAAIVD
jgi:2-haloacid dehalogenase